jgi:hypothetical protein
MTGAQQDSAPKTWSIYKQQNPFCFNNDYSFEDKSDKKSPLR